VGGGTLHEESCTTGVADIGQNISPILFSAAAKLAFASGSSWPMVPVRRR